MNLATATQDEINDLYSRYEIEASELLGRYFNIRKSIWTDEKVFNDWTFLDMKMKHLAKYYNASSLPF